MNQHVAELCYRYQACGERFGYDTDFGQLWKDISIFGSSSGASPGSRSARTLLAITRKRAAIGVISIEQLSSSRTLQDGAFVPFDHRLEVKIAADRISLVEDTHLLVAAGEHHAVAQDALA